jgi:hypothetical protein
MVDAGDRWLPLSPWVEIKRELNVGHVAMPEVMAASRRMFATVSGVGVASSKRVLVDPNPAEAISFDLGDVGRERQLVEESSIWAVLE